MVRGREIKLNAGISKCTQPPAERERESLIVQRHRAQKRPEFAVTYLQLCAQVVLLACSPFLCSRTRSVQENPVDTPPLFARSHAGFPPNTKGATETSVAKNKRPK